MLLIEYLISLSEDEFPAVRDKAEEVLTAININFMRDKNMRSLVELLEENFYDLLTKLPRIIRKSGTFLHILFSHFLWKCIIIRIAIFRHNIFLKLFNFRNKQRIFIF